MGKRGPKQQFTDISCPNEKCGLYGVLGKENIVGNGTYATKAGTVRKFKCKACGRVFNDRTGTVYEYTHLTKEKVDLIVACQADDVGVRMTAAIAGVTVRTVQKRTERSGDRASLVRKVLESVRQGIHREPDRETRRGSRSRVRDRGYKPYRTALTKRIRTLCHRLRPQGSPSPGQDGAGSASEPRHGGEDPSGKRLGKIRRYVSGHVSEEDRHIHRIQKIRAAGLNLFRTDYNPCKQHASLMLSKKQNCGVHRGVTPAMAMGSTAHVWNIGELHGFL